MNCVKSPDFEWLNVDRYDIQNILQFESATGCHFAQKLVFRSQMIPIHWLGKSLVVILVEWNLWKRRLF